MICTTGIAVITVILKTQTQCAGRIGIPSDSGADTKTGILLGFSVSGDVFATQTEFHIVWQTIEEAEVATKILLSFWRTPFDELIFDTKTIKHGL